MGGFALYEGCILPCHLHAVDARRAAGCEFETDGPGAPEKVQNLQVFEFIFVVQDIEKALPGEISGGPGRIALRQFYRFPFEGSADDSHICSTDLKKR